MYNYMNYNPNQGYMDRLNQLQQMQQAQQYQQPIQQMQQQPQQQGIIPVGSIEEVKAFNNYFDGQPHYFIDNVSNKIYIKQLGMNGIPSVTTYSVDNTVEKQEECYCTKEEYNALKSDLESYKSVLEDLLNKLGGLNDE